MKRPPVIRDLSGHPVIFAMHICKLVLPQDWVCNPRPRAPRFSGYLHPLPFHDEVHEFFTGGVGDAARSCGERPVGDEGRESLPAGRHRPENWRATRAKKATKTEVIVEAAMIPRMIVTSAFSDRTEFSVSTPGFARRVPRKAK